MSTITVSLYLVNNVLEEASSNSNNAPQAEAITDIESGDTLNWVLGANSGIASIDSIVASVGLAFIPTPSAANNWTCVVSGILSKIPYNYTVYVTPIGGGGSMPHDPKIKVNSGVHM